MNETRGSDFKDRSLKNASREETLLNVGSVASPLEKKFIWTFKLWTSVTPLRFYLTGMAQC